MNMRLNIKPNPGSCAYVYAWSDNRYVVAYKYWHNHLSESLSDRFLPVSCDDDYYINYKSEVPLEEWIAKVQNSEFNNPKHYRLLGHNCAYAATFALEAGGIKLFDDQPDVFFNRVIDLPFIRIPLRTLTPYDLFYVAKDQKIKQLQASNSETQYHFTDLRIKLWCSFTPLKQEEKLVTKIANEIEKRHKCHPERTEEQIDVLMKTLQLVMHLPSDEECLSYLNLAAPFKQRTPTKTGKLRNQLIMFYLISIGLAVGSLADIAAAYFELNLMTPKQNLGLIFASVFPLFKLPSKIRPLMSSSGSTAEPTELSKSMKELVSLRIRKP